MLVDMYLWVYDGGYPILLLVFFARANRPIAMIFAALRLLKAVDDLICVVVGFSNDVPYFGISDSFFEVSHIKVAAVFLINLRLVTRLSCLGLVVPNEEPFGYLVFRRNQRPIFFAINL